MNPDVCSSESHEAKKQDRAWVASCKQVGVQEIGDVRLVLFNCPACNSTLAEVIQ